MVLQIIDKQVKTKTKTKNQKISIYKNSKNQFVISHNSKIQMKNNISDIIEIVEQQLLEMK